MKDNLKKALMRAKKVCPQGQEVTLSESGCIEIYNPDFFLYPLQDGSDKKATVQLEELYKLVSKIKKEIDSFEVREEEVIIKSGKASYSLPILEDYKPELRKSMAKSFFTCKAEELQKLTKFTSKAVEGRFASGLFLINNAIVATDKIALIKKEIPENIFSGAIIDTKFVNLFQKTEIIHIGTQEFSDDKSGLITIKNDEYSWNFKEIDGTFPDSFERVFPDLATMSKVEIKNLKEGLDAISPSLPKDNYCEMYLKEGILKTEDIGASKASFELEIKTNNQTDVICFNYKHFSDYLNNFEGNFYIKDDISVLVFKGDDHVFVLMPMKKKV